VDNRQAVTDLCRRLDGIPLAIELAAARMSLLEPQEIVTRLDDALSVLGHGPTGVTRHQTLRAALEWSHQLLTVDEQVLLRRLSVFAGSFDLAAVEAVCCAQPLDGANLLDLLGRLVDKSLVQAEQAAGESWYRQLDTVRQFARERLVAAGELSAIAAAHCAHYLAQAVAQDPDLGRGVVAETPRVLERHHDNLRAALQWSCSADPDSAIRLAASLWRFWFLRGYAAEGVDWVQRALAASTTNTPERARALLGLAGLDSRLGRNDRHRELAAEAVTVLESIGATHEAVLTRLVRGALVWATSDLEDAVRIAEDVRARATQLDRPDLVAGTTWLRAMCELSREDATAAAPLLAQCLEELSRVDAESTPFLPVVSPCVVLVPLDGRLQPYFEETLVIGRRVGSVQGIGYVRAAQGYVARLDGNLHAARDVVAEAVDVFAKISDRMGRATALNQLGCLLRDQGDYEGARRCLGEAVELRRRVGDRRGELLTMVNHALLDAVSGKAVDGRRTALQCLTAFEAIDEQPGIAASLSALAAIELISGELRAARALYSRAAHALAPWPRLEAWFRLAGCEITIELGEFDRVDADLARAAVVFSRLGSVVGLDRRNSLRAKLPSR
jgi:tetratricopeptide (TPR) repeat protein